jgi:hypothetical protein
VSPVKGEEMSTFTEEQLRRAHLASQSEEARAKRRATLETKRRLLDEDIVLLWKTGMVPLAIAKQLRVPVDRVSSEVRQAGFETPPYMTTSGPTPETDVCPHCGGAT